MPFTADCGYIKQLQDDPIKHPGVHGASHWHDFYANDRTDALSTVSSLENATVALTTVSMVGYQATFYLASGVSHTFTPGQQVRVEGVKVSFQLSPGYNRVWTVSAVPIPNLSRFVATSAGIHDLSAGAGGTAGDAALSCGAPHGMLTYDTAGYWVPSAYLWPSGVHIIPAHLRVYYFAPDLLGTQIAENIPEGLQLIGGKYDAANPADNPHLQWSCGRREVFHTPTVDHPYDCEPFHDYFGDNVDGPVALVDMPYCWNGLGTAYQNTVYPKDDHGQYDEYCDGDYSHALIALEVRLHMGRAWGGTMNPCGGCLAYDLSALHEDCSSGPCTGTFTVANLTDHFQAGTYVDVTYAGDTNWNSPPGGYLIDHLNGDNSFTVIGLPAGLSECSPADGHLCGAAAATSYSENFTLAGTDDPSRTDVAFYTFHADFWNTWQQAPLVKLENDCARGTSCVGLGAVSNNDFVDGLP